MNLRYRHRVLGVAVAAMFSAQVARLAISPVVPDILDAFSISKGALGLALTGVTAASAVSQYPSGVFGDRYGERRIMVIALALVGIGSLLLALAPSFPFFVFSALFLGVGTGTYFIVSTSLLTGMFERTGQALGVHSAGAPLAGLVAPVSAAYVAVNYDWRIALLLGPLVIFPVCGLLLLQVRPTEPSAPGAQLSAQFGVSEIYRLLYRRSTLFVIFLGTVSGFTWQSYITFFPTFLIEYRLFTPGRASLLFGVTFLLSALSLPLIGHLSDLIGRDSALAFSLTATGIGLALFVYVPGRIAIGAGTLVLGIGLSWGGVLQSRIMSGFGTEERGAGFGLVRTFYILLGSVGSVTTGTLVDLSGWQAAYGLVIVLLFVTVGMLVVNRFFGVGM